MKQGAQSSALWLPRGVGMGWEVGGRFKREGPYVYLWLTPVDVWQKTTQHCKAFMLQLKKKKLKQNNVSNGLMRNVLSWRIWCNTCLFIFDFFKSSGKYQFHIKYHCFIGALLGGSVQRLSLVLKWRWVHLGPAMVGSCCPPVSLQVLKSLWQAECWARLAPRIQKCKFQKPRAKSRKMEYILKWTPHPEGNFDPPKYYKNTKEDSTE